MRVTVDGWAWLPRSHLTEVQVEALRYALTIYPRKGGDFPGEKPAPIKLYVETPDSLGVPREYFLSNKKLVHDVELRVTDGAELPSPFEFKGKLRKDQEEAVQVMCGALQSGERLGGILRAGCGAGKTVMALAVAARLGVPTLVVVHKEFLVKQWLERILGSQDDGIPGFLPEASVGFAQQDTCDFHGRHIVIGMVHSLAARDYPEAFYRWPGLVIIDELHRMGAATWCPVAPKFHARYRLGLTATPRRKDGAENAFRYHIGDIVYNSETTRLTPKIRRVYSDFKPLHTQRFNSDLATLGVLIKFLCANEPRNNMIVDRLAMALEADRKILVLSDRLNHLSKLEALLRKKRAGRLPTIGYYVGGMSDEALDKAAQAQVIFATWPYAAEGLDIPALDTLFMATPRSDVEQGVGRILRAWEGKKEPVVVDFRDDKVRQFANMAEARDKLYKRMGAG